MVLLKPFCKIVQFLCKRPCPVLFSLNLPKGHFLLTDFSGLQKEPFAVPKFRDNLTKARTVNGRIYESCVLVFSFFNEVALSESPPMKMNG